MISWTPSGAGRGRQLLLALLATLLCLLPLTAAATPTAAAAVTAAPAAAAATAAAPSAHAPATVTPAPAPPEPATPRGTGEPAAPTPEVPTSALVLTLTDIRPAVLTPGEDLVVQGTVSNPTDAAVAQPELRLRAQQTTPISRSLLERWLDPDSLSATTLLHAERLEDPLEPGDTASFTLTVPAGNLPLARTYTAWGPRGIEVDVHDAAAPVLTDPVAVRSFLLWWPDIEVVQMPLAVLAAAVPTAPERMAARDTGASVAEVSAERLTPLVTALDHPGVDLALDPSLLVDAPRPPELSEAVADEPTKASSDPTSPDVTAEELRGAVSDLGRRPGRTLHALPWADADAAALAHTGRTGMLEAAVQERDDALAAAGLAAASVHGRTPGVPPSATTDLGWPAADEPDATTVEALAATGAAALVLPSSSLQPTTALTYTASGRADLDTGTAQLPTLLSDERLSALLTGSLLPVSPTEDTTIAELDTLTARQYLLAETAVVARERPADPRDLLLTVPRDFAGDPQLLDAQLATLADVPWLERVQVSDLLADDAPDLQREVLPSRVVEPGEVGAAELDRTAAVLEQTAAFAGVLAEPDTLVEAVRTDVLEVTAAAWRELPDPRAELVAAIEASAEARRGLVAAQPGSDLLLINDEVHIPVAVTNALDQVAHVVVRLDPRDPRLVADEEVPLEVPPHGSATAQIPVHAVGSGDVVVDVVLTAPDGAAIDEPTEIQVRVRAGWETFGTAVVAGILVVMLVVGIIRTVRRGRRSTEATEEVPA